MALLKTLSLLLLLLLTLLGLGLVQPSYGQPSYQTFKRQHVDSNVSGVNSLYCNTMMQTRGMTTKVCKRFNTFINESLPTIESICNTTNIRCKNGMMNCHAGVVKAIDCDNIGGFPPRNCLYQTIPNSTRPVVIACNGTPPVPVHLDR